MMIGQETLEIKSDLVELARIRIFLRNFCQNFTDPGLNDDQLSQLELAVNEAAANVMKHAYNGRGDQAIRIEAAAEISHVTVQLLHHGASFSPDNIPPPAFDGSRNNGFGVYLIERCVDEVRYTHGDQGENCIFLRKNYVME